MAKFFPASIALGTPASETAVWAALKGLPDPWRVFHHIEWQAERDGRPGDGEADFVLLHPEVGILVVEVKGGSIAVGGGRWYSFDRRGRRHEIHDPFEQAKTSKYSLVSHLKNAVSGLAYLPAGHCVVFPDLTDVSPLGVNAPRELILTRADLNDAATAVNRVVGHWQLAADLPDGEIAAISHALAPTVELRRTLKDDLLATSAQIAHWTDEQLGALDAMRRNARQLVFGSAGTGKTVLAKEKTRRLAQEGKRVLLTCFNQPLAHAIAEDMRAVDRVHVATFHGLCRQLAGRAGLAFPSQPSSQFWDEGAPDLLVEAAQKTGFNVAALVVDEGQDFHPSWWTALELLLDTPGSGEFYVFSDVHQAIYRPDWTPPFPGPSYDLTRNCRNTVAIAERVAAVFRDPVATLGATGPDPEYAVAINREGGAKALRSAIHRYLNEGKLDAGQLAVICQRRQDVEHLRGLSLAGHRGVQLGEWGSDGFLVETIHRFKGLEADAVVVILESVEDPVDRSLAYIGISRARAQLLVIGPPAVASALSWPDGPGHS